MNLNVCVEEKSFIQNEWINSAEGDVSSEKSMVKPSGRKGRMDIFIRSDDGLVAIVEIKNSDWDRMSTATITRNVKRPARQIWDYIESQLNSGKEVSPGIIFPKHPNNDDRLDLIERLFEEEGIPVV